MGWIRYKNFVVNTRHIIRLEDAGDKTFVVGTTDTGVVGAPIMVVLNAVLMAERQSDLLFAITESAEPEPDAPAPEEPADPEYRTSRRRQR